MDQDAAWAELWDGLHHQGDVDEASYAAVPHLVKIQAERGDLNSNFYALIATIEIERHRSTNPPIPAWLLAPYAAAWNTLSTVALRDFQKATDLSTARAILGVLALSKELRQIGTIVSLFDESEVREIMDHYRGES